MITRLFLAIFLSLAPLSVVAGPDRVSILLSSYHLDAKSTFNEVNPGVFLTWERRLDWSLGVYQNSYGRTGLAGTVALPVFERGEFTLNAFAGAAYYPKDGRNFAVHVGDVVPIGGLMAQYRNVFMQVLPSDGVEVDAILTFGLTFGLGN